MITNLFLPRVKALFAAPLEFFAGNFLVVVAHWEYLISASVNLINAAIVLSFSMVSGIMQ